MKATWRTLWQQNDIVVYRDEVEVDRLPADRIERVYLIYRGAGDTPGDIAHSIVELAGGEGFLVFEPLTGFAGRVNFERQSFWQERACVYWVAATKAVMPWRLRLEGWRSEAHGQSFRRLGREALAGSVARWPHAGPQTWEDRKRLRLERSRPFGHPGSAHA